MELTREELDEFCSKQPAEMLEAAIAEGKFDDEIVPVDRLKLRKKQLCSQRMKDLVLVQQKSPCPN